METLTTVIGRDYGLIPVCLAAAHAGVSEERMRVVLAKGKVRSYAWLGGRLVGVKSLEDWMASREGDSVMANPAKGSKAFIFPLYRAIESARERGQRPCDTCANFKSSGRAA